ncbi:Dual specificity protein phosphatase 19 [Caenorhabditis elegans]|uniref:Dual specificity protein phosphatase 19 n=1 Tax=Caenorhabditis elegans TaxID=6239 RepID=Q95XK5_CAEEL|nr:Dual specificity protein phosphatase 19 [Caenorhabditis elegans]CCD73846.1 Dual specificity protein phosphatase 19 [Caenorhabditis elegans]|eukprot:NP_497538.1 Uncharacterized protein CELE_Y54F10BM.13 [Caenorhabditis elegans]
MPNLDELLKIKNRLKATEITTTLPSGEVRVEKRGKNGEYEEIQDSGEDLVDKTTENISNRRRKKVEYLQRRGFIVDLEPDLVVGEALPDLLFGSQDVAADLPILENRKITHIVNVGTGIPNHFPKKFEYLQIDILDLPETRIIDYFERVFEFIDKVRQNEGIVFIHCNAGISRSATFVVAYLMKNLKISCREAMDKCRETRSIRPNTGFAQQLKEYEAILVSLGLSS